MKHKHYEMIVAKAENMDLVVFEKDPSGWIVRDTDILHMNPEKSYFLCLPQYKEACLHWLNGGLTEVKSKLTKKEWEGCANPEQPIWRPCIGWMRGDAHYRVKPRMQKRWIVYNPKAQMIVVKGHFKTEEDAYNNMFGCKFRDDYLYLEIEVEV